ncbi:hypothetical protein FQN51_002313 [Onygenales sp. PD_10]|nr:hypothetical protein FQN51_002313 [Onygenales sp. PD_10]
MSTHPTHTPPQPQPQPQAQTSKALASSLLSECTTLLSELTFLQSHLASLEKPNLVELRQFKSFVQSELKSLEKLAEQAAKTATPVDGDGTGAESNNNEDDDGELDEAEVRVLHSLRSSNLPFYSAVWKVGKTECTGLVAFSKRFYWYKSKRPVSGGGGIGQAADSDITRSLHGLQVSGDESKVVDDQAKSDLQKRSVLVDIVADNGEEWVKVSTITPSRLLFELAKRGWEMGYDSGSENGGSEDAEEPYRLQNDDSGDDDEDEIELVRLAMDMKKAAELVRVRYRHPRIRFVLPKIIEGKTHEIDAIIKEIRKVGVIVECGADPEDGTEHASTSNGTNGHQPPKPLEDLLPVLLPDPHPHMTSTLNVDCTLLLALVSDLSHYHHIDPSPSHHRAIRRQIELETKQPLVPSELWPAMGNRHLVCTQEAAKRMNEIVDTIGTPTERTRTKLIMGQMDKPLPREDIVSQFQELSDHSVPLDWNLPIKVVDAQVEIESGWKDGRLTGPAQIVASQLSDINRSVFLYGWVTCLMTISSNRTVAKQIEVLVEENRNGDDDLAGPLVWVCDTARSLVGKDSNRKP